MTCKQDSRANFDNGHGKNMNDCFCVMTRVVFLYPVLLGIGSYTEQNLAIRSRLYGVEYFCYSE